MRGSKLFLGSLYFLVVLIFIQILLTLLAVPEYLFPKPTKVFNYIWEYKELFLQHSLVTLTEAFAGVFLAFFVGILLGGFFLYYRTLESLIFPILFILQVLPLVALSPIIILWFGFGIFSKIWIVFIFALYPILSFFKNGLENIDPEMIYMAKLLRGSQWDIFIQIYFPFCLFNAILGLKVALTYSLTSAIVAEFLGSSKGLGVLLTRSLSSFNSLALFGNVYIIIIISSSIYLIACEFEKYFKKKLGY